MDFSSKCSSDWRWLTLKAKIKQVDNARYLEYCRRPYTTRRCRESPLKALDMQTRLITIKSHNRSYD